MATTKKKLETIESVVKNILKDNEATRSSDDILYEYVCNHFCDGASSMTLANFLRHRAQMKCPNFASVTRARRKVFEKNPDLKPEGATQVRVEEEQTYRDYALNS